MYRIGVIKGFKGGYLTASTPIYTVVILNSSITLLLYILWISSAWIPPLCISPLICVCKLMCVPVSCVLEPKVLQSGGKS